MVLVGWLPVVVVAVAAVLGTSTHDTINGALAFQGPYPRQRSHLLVTTSSRPSSLLSPPSPSSYSTSTQLCAKKRRRRKDRVDTTTTTTQSSIEESANTPDEGGTSPPTMMSTSDLPDFDMDDDPDSAPSSPPKAKRQSSSSSSSSSLSSSPVGNLETITPEMMGSQGAGEARSIDQLIADRSLEQRFEFDESDVDENIPDFVQLAARSSSSASASSPESSDISSMIDAPMGKKKQRQAERRANAINRAKEEAEAESTSGLFNIPFFSPDKDQVSGIKILENGAWVGIGILVLWELYLNSPFFERAAPLAPVVFEDLFM